MPEPSLSLTTTTMEVGVEEEVEMMEETIITTTIQEAFHFMIQCLSIQGYLKEALSSVKM